jgi:FtsP/CotA-like multicopper oxidase with cupredoxin domain
MKAWRWWYSLGIFGVAIAVAGGLAMLTGSWKPFQPTAQPSPTVVVPTVPKATVDFGAQRLMPTMINGIPTYDFTLKKVMWDIGGGDMKEAYTVNGMVPGPELRLAEGQRVQIRVKNELDEASSIHWHGLILPAAQDGVAHLSQDPIEPGETFTYDFAPQPPGTHWYHSHFDGAKQVSSGLFGPLIIEPKDPNHPTHSSKYDVEHFVLITDAGLGLTLNGKSFPFNLPMKVTTGQRVLMRMVNTGTTNHPMHLHGHDFRVVAKDSNAIAQPMLWNTVDVAPGETYDVAFTASNPGSWLFHCHILPHSEGKDGMYGLTNLLEYKGYEPDPSNPHTHLAPSEQRLTGTPGKHEH